MSKFGAYSGKQLLELKLEKRKWLVESLIKEKDSVIIVGDSKAGKSLLKQQLCCSMTSAHPFLNKFDVIRPCKITDIQLEGELEDTQDRFNRLTQTLEFEPENYHLLFEPPLSLNSLKDTHELIHRIEHYHLPDVIFVDPVYFAFQGSLSEDQPVRAFLGNLRIIKDYFNCSIILIHHTHKIHINFKTGQLIDEGDNAMFGSKFFSAFPDHILLFVYDKKNDLRLLSCATQRSGDIAKTTQLKLVQPSPLYFEEADEQPARENLIYEWLDKAPDGLTVSDLQSKTNLARRTIYAAFKLLFARQQLVKSVGRPVVYKLKKFDS